ncbi:hypothetical protein GCM10027446_27330 [Angustibacter peucedani]
MTGLVDPGRSRDRHRPASLEEWRSSDDGGLPPVKQLAALLGRSVLLPVFVWFVVLSGVGYLLAHGLKDAVKGEDGVNRSFAAGRTPTWNTITNWVSHVGNTETVILVMLVSAFIVWRISGRLREPVALVVGVACQALVFLFTTLLIARPRPDVPKLDQSPPTSSFPSGHTGASTALYLGLVIICVTRLQRSWLKVLSLLFFLLPVGVAMSRLYRGMHHPTDVTFGMLNGAICAVIAYLAFRPRD